MTIRNKTGIVFWRVCSFPYQLRYEILPAKHFIATFFEVFLLIVINTDKYYTVISQQILCQFQTRINHIKPVRMKTAIALGVLRHAVASLIVLPAVGKILIRTLSKVILVYKVASGVVRRIYKNAVFDTNRKSLLRHIRLKKA